MSLCRPGLPDYATAFPTAEVAAWASVKYSRFLFCEKQQMRAKQESLSRAGAKYFTLALKAGN